jgi:hypothetical protein
MYAFNSLYPNKLIKNIELYIANEKYEIVEIIFNIINQLDRPDDTF